MLSSLSLSAPQLSHRFRFRPGILAVVLSLTFLAGARAGIYSLGVGEVVEGPDPVADSVLLVVKPETNSWVAVANADWLHLDPASQSGIGCLR